MNGHTRFGASHPGLRTSTPIETAAPSIDYEPRLCACGRKTIHPVCFECSANPFRGVNFSMEVGAEDSTDPRRVADGSAKFNVGLPGVDRIVGTRADGKPKLEYRPITNSEVGTGRSLREYAKRHGLEQAEPGRSKRAIGSR